MLRRPIPTLLLLASLAAGLAACGSDDSAVTEATLQTAWGGGVPIERPANTQRVLAGELVGKLEAAGFRVTREAASPVDPSLRGLVSEEPRSAVTLGLEDRDGRSCRMTFLEFASWMPPAQLDARPIDGFAVRNWFVPGDAPTYFVVRVREALAR
jgi:hypothetical protein